MTYYYTNTKTSVKYFIDIKFTKYYKLFLVALTKLFKLRLANNIIVEIITYAIRIILFFEKYLEELFYLVILLVKFDIILDIS